MNDKKYAEKLHAFALQQTATPQKALEYLTKVVKIDPEHGGAWLDRGNVLHILERHEEAMHCYDRAGDR
ncbi:MAG: hypothetical protein ACFFC7_24960 [Candidatus Hermodarchaeota archaeon]